jgi:hypothetical protein
VKLVLSADTFDMFEDGCVARAHQLHGAAIPELAECDYRLNRVGGFERDVVKYQCGRPGFDCFAHCAAVGKFDGIDA